MTEKRAVDLVIISDTHLGTIGCHAKELVQYLDSIKPGMLILNGDIVDIWQFSKHYWPKSHMKVIKKLVSMMSKGVPVVYLTGNHDDLLRKFSPFELGSFQLKNKLVMNLNGKQAWIFHGDVFDVTMKHSRWLAKLGAVGYDFLILLNRFCNNISQRMGKGKFSFSARIKNSVKKAVQFIDDFEMTAAELAVENGYDYVICGHIHQPVIRTVETEKGSVIYLNSGDWIENLSALEFHGGEWKLYKHLEQPVMIEEEEEVAVPDLFLEEQVLQFLSKVTS